MAREDRQKRKQKRRQARLAQRKHFRRSLPKTASEWGDDERDAPDAGEPFDEEFAELGDMPSPFLMERSFRAMHRSIGDHEFASPDELSDLLNANFIGKPTSAGTKFDDPVEQAQELAYQAMETNDVFTGMRLAKEALELDPNCLDARVINTFVTTSDTSRRIALIKEALKTAEGLFEPGFFEENRGHFWGIVETRPYMRARETLSELLLKAGRTSEAIANHEDMLDLNPGDNQGVRFTLLGLYFCEGNLTGTQRLLAQYEEDATAIFAWGRVLERFLHNDIPEAANALAAARRGNAHVEPYLTGAKSPPAQLPEYMTFGGESEAVECAARLGEAWAKHPEAVRWLRRCRA